MWAALLSLAKRRPIFEGEQLDQTIAAAHEPFRTLFTVAALTGARISELCGLTWADVRVDDLEEAEIEFGWQVDRHGNRRPTKTDGSARTVPVPRQLAAVLARHRRAARDPRPKQLRLCHRHGPSIAATERFTGTEGRLRRTPSMPRRNQRSRSCMRSTTKERRFPSLAGSCPRCIPSDTPLPRALCWQARASMRSRSS